MAVRILVVDDDRAVRESLRRSLSFNGYSVELAHDGVEALSMIASDRPDGLVLDVMMPRLDGLEVCRHLRSTGDDLPILVLTARDSVSERVAGLDAGQEPVGQFEDVLIAHRHLPVRTGSLLSERRICIITIASTTVRHTTMRETA